MTPTEAGFDGAKGMLMRIPQFEPDARYQLARGIKPPSQVPSRKFTEQLTWWMPEGRLPKLLWCNANDEWFELSFTPIPKP